MEKDQKQKEQVCMLTNKIKFIEKSMKYDIGAKLRVIFTLQMQLNSTPVLPLQWEGLSYRIPFADI